MPYSIDEINRINQETSNFYSTFAQSFSATRQNKWDGWERCFSCVESIFSNKDSVNILDFACGNFRFEEFLSKKSIDCKLNIDAIDNCKFSNMWQLSDNIELSFKELDIVNSLVNNDLSLFLNKYDLIVSFGLMHHIPSEKLRVKLLKTLLDSLNDNGYLVVSFWQFEKSKRIFEKANKMTPLAKNKLKLSELENNDCFLNWQDNTDVFRFCHNFTDYELEQLSFELNVCAVDSYNSDGNNLNLNKYLIFQKTI